MLSFPLFPMWWTSGVNARIWGQGAVTSTMLQLRMEIPTSVPMALFFYHHDYLTMKLIRGTFDCNSVQN